MTIYMHNHVIAIDNIICNTSTNATWDNKCACYDYLICHKHSRVEMFTAKISILAPVYTGNSQHNTLVSELLSE